MGLTVDFKRAQLRIAHERLALVAGKTLRDFMLDRLVELADGSSGRPTIRSTSGAGHSVEFADPGSSGNPSASDAMAMWSEFIDLYSYSQAALVASGNASPTEGEIVEEMLDRIQAIRSFADDFSEIREAVVT